MSEADKDLQKPGEIAKKPPSADYSLFLLGESIHELRLKIEKLEERFDRKVDSIREDTTAIRERTAVIEERVSSLPRLNEKIDAIQESLVSIKEQTSSLPRLNEKVDKINRWIAIATGAILVFVLVGQAFWSWFLRTLATSGAG